MLCHGIETLIGGTPLTTLPRIAKKRGLQAELLAKLEFMEPTGSVKDRAALGMLEDAERAGCIAPGATIIEPTSGNTGIGLAAVGAAKGYRVVLTMPDSMSVERRRLLAAYGAELVLTPGALGMRGAVEMAEKLRDETPGSFIPGQFDNPANADAHYRTTGPELWRDADGRIDAFVAGIGTGGTFTGVGRFLRERNPDVLLVAVEPDASPLLSEGRSGRHRIQGIGANFVPSVLDRLLISEIARVTDDEAVACMRELAVCEGLFAGISSGAALAAAYRLCTRPDWTGKTVAVLLPDAGSRYLSV